MPETEFENGKRWGEEAIRQIGKEFEISLDLQWGPLWAELAKSRRARRPASLQLILSRGRVRKILWLSADDLRSADSKRSEEPAARERIRSRVSAAIADIARKTSVGAPS